MRIPRERGGVVIGAVLVAVGLALLATNVLDLGDAGAIGSISAVLLIAYAFTRTYGFLVPGMILAGAAIGTGVQDAGYDESGGFVAVYLGAGFLGIWLIDALASGPARWWPLIPGSLLVTFGAATATEGTPAGALIEQLWPLALVIAGLALIVTAARRARVSPPSVPAKGGT